MKAWPGLWTASCARFSRKRFGQTAALFCPNFGHDSNFMDCNCPSFALSLTTRGRRMRASMWWVMLLILIGGAAGWEMSKLLVAFIEEGIARRKHEQWLKENDE
jgi:hypothetical protein